jgi:hypothetical protein
MPANGLPPEILSRILEYHDCNRDLVTATHVCRYWRSTLVQIPHLWTSFQFKSSPDLDRTLTYLERSKSTVIDVKITLCSQRDLEALKHLASHIARTKSLIIDGPYAEIDAISPLFRSPAPSLQRLEIDSPESPGSLPDDFLGQQVLSLRFLSFSGIRLTFKSPFPLPNLTEFNLSLPQGAGPLHMGTLLWFFSASPRLQRIRINTGHEVLHGIAPDQVISLESLVEFDFTCKPAGRILPYLRLPHLKQLRVCLSLGSGQVPPKLADLLPFHGRSLITGATEMGYSSDGRGRKVDLSGKGIYASLAVFTPGPTPIDWFSDETYVPFGQIEDLTVEGHRLAAADFPINSFKNLRTLRVIPWDLDFAKEFLLLLYPRAAIPCQSLREIWYVGPTSLCPLIRLVRERKRAGHQPESVWLLNPHKFHDDLVKELRKYAGEVRVEERD